MSPQPHRRVPSVSPIPVAVACLAVLGTALAIAPASVSADVVDRVVLRVNDKIATLVDYEQRRLDTLRELAAQEPSPEELERLRADLGNRVFRKIFEDLLLQSRADQLRIFPDEDEVDAAVARIRQGFGIESDDEFAAELSKQGISLAEFREQVREQLRVREVIAREVTSQIELEEDDLRRVYRAERELYVTPQRWRVRELIVLEGTEEQDPDELRALAEAIRDEVIAGRAIEEVAAEYAEAGTTSELVDLGWVGPGELAPALEAAIEALGPGEISEPVAARGGYHILELQEFEEAAQRPFAEVADLIETKERRRLFAQKFEEYLRELEEDAYVRADPPPDAAGFRTVAGAGGGEDPFAAFEPISEGAVREESDPGTGPGEGGEPDTEVDAEPVPPPDPPPVS